MGKKGSILLLGRICNCQCLGKGVVKAAFSAIWYMKQLRGIKPLFWPNSAVISSTTAGSSDLVEQRAVAVNKKRRRRFISQWTNLPPVWTYLRLHWHRQFWLKLQRNHFLRKTEKDTNGITSTVTNSSHKPCSMFISTGKTRQFIGCSGLRVKKFSDYCVNDRGSVIICQASEKLPQLLPHCIG